MKSKQSNAIWNRNKVTADEIEKNNSKWNRNKVTPYEIETK